MMVERRREAPGRHAMERTQDSTFNGRPSCGKFLDPTHVLEADMHAGAWSTRPRTAGPARRTLLPPLPHSSQPLPEPLQNPSLLPFV